MAFKVSSAEAEDLAACLQIPYIECSAKFRQNVDQLFHTLIRQIRQFRYLERRSNGNTAMALENGSNNTVMDHADWGMRNGGYSNNKQQQNGIRKKGKKEKEKSRNCRIQWKTDQWIATMQAASWYYSNKMNSSDFSMLPVNLCVYPRIYSDTRRLLFHSFSSDFECVLQISLRFYSLPNQ